MSDRARQRAEFLDRAGWAQADSVPLAGDASARQYTRLRLGDTCAVLMDADPKLGNDTQAFVSIAGFLRQSGMSAPEILAQDTRQGFLLLEDLGDALIARIATPEIEDTLYQAAIDVLIALHRLDPPDDVPVSSPQTLTAQTDLAFDWYASHADGHQKFAAAFQPLVERIWLSPLVLVLRDYHAENLIWLPDRMGIAKVGLLDFQDALAGHPAYDLVSLLEDARRDVAPGLRAQMIGYYVQETGSDPAEFTLACAVLGAQRNLRILGVFARLCAVMGKPAYIDLIPRVWNHLQANLSHPDLAALRRILDKTLPTPDPAFLDTLRARCPTNPTR